MAKILVVDDNLKDLNFIRSTLKEEGYSVTTASNGAEAVDKLSEKVELIFLDIQMPTLSGYELAKLLREKVSSGVKIYYVTILPKNKIEGNCVDGVIHKPLDAEKLLKVAKQALA